MVQAGQILQRISRSAVIAGGYPRDAVLGGRVKDIDIFVDSSRYPTDDRRENLCDRIYEAFGQTWECTTPRPDVLNRYGVDPETQEPFQTYNSLTTEGEWNRVNVIFSRNNQKLNSFDWSICRFFVDVDSVNPIYNITSFDADLRNIRYVGGVGAMTNVAGLIEHATRIKNKYEGARFMFDLRVLAQMGDLYARMLQGGLIGENARAVLPTETEAPIGNTVGLGTGTTSVPPTRNFIGGPRTRVHTWWDEAARFVPSADEAIREAEAQRRQREISDRAAQAIRALQGIQQRRREVSGRWDTTRDTAPAPAPLPAGWHRDPVTGDVTPF